MWVAGGAAGEVVNLVPTDLLTYPKRKLTNQDKYCHLCDGASTVFQSVNLEKFPCFFLFFTELSRAFIPYLISKTETVVLSTC